LQGSDLYFSLAINYCDPCCITYIKSWIWILIFLNCYRFFLEVKTLELIVSFTNSHFGLFLNKHFKSYSTFLNTIIVTTCILYLYINIDKVTTCINYVMVTNMVSKKFVSIISIWVIKEICCWWNITYIFITYACWHNVYAYISQILIY
jgi:hypothetical protein